MNVSYASQYDSNCVTAETGDTAQGIIDFCHEVDAIRRVDGLEFCVELRTEVGPELWTERALRRSLPAEGS